MSGLMRNPKAWGGRDYGYKPDCEIYSVGDMVRRFRAKVNLSVTFGAVAYEGGRLSDNCRIDNPLELPSDCMGRELDFVMTGAGRCIYEVGR